MASINERDLRLRVERFLRGDWRAQDLITLFLSQRAAPNARPSLTGIGDFIAHRDKRDRGAPHRYARSIFFSVNTLYEHGLGASVPVAKLTEAYKASFATFREGDFMKELGIGNAAAQSMLARCIAREFGQRTALNPKEHKLLSILENPATHPVFAPTQIIDDLLWQLADAGLLYTPESDDFRRGADFITAFAVSVMHGVEIVLDGGHVAVLIGHGARGACLQVWADVPIMVDADRWIRARVPFFLTGLLTDDHCSTALYDGGSGWECPVELDAAGRLAPIG